MLTRSLLAACALLSASHHAFAQAPIMEGEPPTLVLAIVVDQMRFDYLTRYGSEFNGGLQRLIEEGAVFTNAHYEAAPSVTAVGHSTFLSGAVPAVSGIAGNLYYSRADGRPVQSITDRNVTPLGDTAGASPHRLLVTTVGDELKASGKGGKVFGVSLKDRSAILPAGRGADGAFWVGDSGDFVSSNWYFPELPAWVDDFNTSKPSDSYAGVEWLGVELPATPGSDFYAELDKTPYSDQMVLDFALRLMAEENLGDDALTDLLAVSFSAT
ncbi:MAG: alkaline phosphatase family protein, partial [Pseudohongiellaceae bacterium]